MPLGYRFVRVSRTSWKLAVFCFQILLDAAIPLAQQYRMNFHFYITMKLPFSFASLKNMLFHIFYDIFIASEMKSFWETLASCLEAFLFAAKYGSIIPR